MEATRLQMQNFLIFLLDLVGVTVGYFAAVWLRFGNIETGYTVMGNDTYYRWLIAIVVLMMIYFLFRPNRGFFKRKFIEEMRMNLQTVILMAAGMAMVAFLIQDVLAVLWEVFHHYQVRFLGFDMQDRIMESSCQGSSS